MLLGEKGQRAGGFGGGRKRGAAGPEGEQGQRKRRFRIPSEKFRGQK